MPRPEPEFLSHFIERDYGVDRGINKPRSNPDSSTNNQKLKFLFSQKYNLRIYPWFYAKTKIRKIIFSTKFIMNEFRSYAFTVRPKDGVPEDSDLEKAIIDYVAKYQGFVCYEKEDVSRHLHAQIFFEKAKRKYDVNKQLNLICTRTIKEWDLDQQHVLHKGTKIAYNDDWYLNYCNKEDTVFLYRDLPKDTSLYYPSIEDQQKAMAKSHAVDKTFHHLKEMYDKDPCPSSNPSQQQIHRWLYEQMYVKKTIRVIEDKRKFNQRATALYHYLPREIDKYDMF